MLKVIVCFAAVFVALCDACPPVRARPFPSSPQHRNQFYEWLRKSNEPSTPPETPRGDFACDRNYQIYPGATITQEYFDNNVCLVLGEEPLLLDQFCTDFKDSSSSDTHDYYVMVATPSDLVLLQDDIAANMLLIADSYYKIPPIQNNAEIHYYSDGRYDWIKCAEQSGRWTGTRIYNQYAQYIPTGTEGNTSGAYSIYRGCPPVAERPGLSEAGSC